MGAGSRGLTYHVLMAAIRRLSGSLRVVPKAPAGRATAVGGPRLAGRADLGKTSAEQLIQQIAGYEASSASNAYALGLCLRELSKPERYRDELGFETFEALLVARKLPSRVTAFKLIQVVTAFSEEELAKLGGPAKGYALIRLAKRQGANTDPRRFLAPKARVAGVVVSAASVREIDRISSATKGMTVTTEHSGSAERVTSQLGAELGRLGIAHRMRLHWHPDDCVSVHLDPGAARQLLEALKSYRAHVKTS